MTNALATHKIGDVVTPNPDAGWARKMIGATYVITELPRGARGVNFKASPCDADGVPVAGQRLRGPGWALLPYDADSPQASIPAPVPLPPVGSIVTPNGQTDLPDGVYTVIGHTDATRIRVVQIGDASGRYYRAAARGVDPLDPAAVIDALAQL